MKKLAVLFYVLLTIGCGGGTSSVPPQNVLPPPTSTPNNPDIPLSEVKTIAQSIDGQIINRPYLVRYPEDATKNSYPVIFFFHGAGGNGEGLLNGSYSISTLIDEEKFIGIFPDGYQNRWNVSSETNADDVEFARLIFSELSNFEIFNTDKIYGIGISNGAGIVNKIAKETTIFQGIAPIISQQTVQVGEITPSQSVSVFQVNATDDELVPLVGGDGVAGNIFMSAQASAENWALNAGCNMTPNMVMLVWGEYSVRQYEFDSCLDDRKVRYFIVEGAGHTANFGEDVDLYGLVWQFFNSTDASQPGRNFKILALGDSYTIGESVCRTCNFPEQLKERLASEFSSQDVFELEVVAQNGWTTTDLKSAIEEENLPDDFDLVTLLIGVNNQFQNQPFSLYETEFVELVNLAITLGATNPSNLIVLSMPDYSYTPFGQNFNTPTIRFEITAYNEFSQEYCESNQLSYVYITDITDQGLDNAFLVASDGLHPSTLAYSQFVDRLMPLALTKLNR